MSATVFELKLIPGRLYRLKHYVNFYSIIERQKRAFTLYKDDVILFLEHYNDGLLKEKRFFGNDQIVSAGHVAEFVPFTYFEPVRL